MIFYCQCLLEILRREIGEDWPNNLCETKVWLILILMITKQGLELIIIFQV